MYNSSASCKNLRYQVKFILKGGMGIEKNIRRKKMCHLSDTRNNNGSSSVLYIYR